MDRDSLSSTATFGSYLDHLGVDPKRITEITAYSATATDGQVKIAIVDWHKKTIDRMIGG